MSRRIILDTDPGHDDAIAMLLAAGNSGIDLAAITTVAGNQTLDKVTFNALAVCQIGEIDAPVAAGAAGPLVRPQQVAADIHGESGLDGPALPRTVGDTDPRHGVDVIVETVMGAAPGTVTLVPIGPLTNVAMAVRKEPRIVDRVHEVVLMGGSYTRGNRTPAAEFNIWADPEAARIVFEQDWTVTMVGLDVTHQATATPEVLDRIREVGSPAGRLVVDMLDFYGSAYRSAQRLGHPPVHDPVTVAYLIDPDVMQTRPASVAVETAGTHTAGMTVTDFDGITGAPLRARVGVSLDHGRFWDLVVAALAR